MSHQNQSSNGEEPNDKLQQLLALKRHETPPPGHFDRLSSTIMARLDEKPDSYLEFLWNKLTSQAWFQPAAACSAAAAVLVLFALAFVNADKQSLQPNTASLMVSPGLSPTNPVGALKPATQDPLIPVTEKTSKP